MKPGEIATNDDLHFCLADCPVFPSEEPKYLSTPHLMAQDPLTQQKPAWLPGDSAGSIRAAPAEQPTETPCPPLPTTSHLICPEAAGEQPVPGDTTI